MRRKPRTGRRSTSSIPRRRPRRRSYPQRSAPERKLPRKTVDLIDLGRRPYREALAVQRDLHGLVARGSRGDTWLVVEHEAVVTLGRAANPANVLVARDELTARGIDVVEVERGGDATFHGPGQIVVYPIVRLERFREVVPLVSALERAVVAAVATFGIVACPRGEHRGVYVGDDAIAAIGLSVRAMTSSHGVALNVTTDLTYASLIVPCGTPQFGVTSIARASGRTVDLADGRDALLRALEAEFDVAFAPSLADVAC